MTLLLDTHVFIWLMYGNPRISHLAQQHIQQASTQHQLYLSAISIWEIAMLVAKNRISLDRDVQDWINQALQQSKIQIMPLLPDISIASTRLPTPFHADPSDRIIVATARHFNATLMTEDRLILAYAEQGHLHSLNASS